jgi:hypothetical protein
MLLSLYLTVLQAADGLAYLIRQPLNLNHQYEHLSPISLHRKYRMMRQRKPLKDKLYTLYLYYRLVKVVWRNRLKNFR